MKLGYSAQGGMRCIDMGVVVTYGFWTGVGGASVYLVDTLSVYTLDAQFSVKIRDII